MADYYKIPTATSAQLLCDSDAECGHSTFAGILIEEVAEVVESATLRDGNLRNELVQVAAVAATWIDAINRRGESS